MRSIKILNLVPTVFFLFLLTGISHSQENLQSIVPKIPVQKGGLESVLLDGLEKDQDWVEEGLTGNYSMGGVGAVLSNQSSRLMKFNGMKNDSGYFHGNADLSYHEGSYFANFLAEDIGFENRNLLLDFGKYDDYKLTASFSQSSQLLTDNSKTPLEGLGGSNFTLPTGFVTGPSGATISVAGVKDSDLKIDGRDTTVFGFLKSVGKNTFGLNYKRETKNGSRSLGAVVGTNGGNARSIVLPETFDQTTNEMTASFLHVDENSQLKVEYFLSLFDNRIESVTFQSPYSGDIDLSVGGVVTAPGAGLISRAPDNSYHRFSASGRWNLSRTARVSAVMEYGLMSQDDKLFAFALGTSTDLLPRQSAEAKTHSLHFSLNASARPVKNLSVSTHYRHYQTINDTPSTLFLAVVNDTQGQVAGNSARALISQPYDTTQDQMKLDASYRVFKATHFKLGYEVELMQRSHRAVEESWENTFKGSIRSTYIPNTSINLK
ncbi:MAG: MtrB/PioB family decaheme-associated outer membrane protein, partial [Nitrospinales bacterium]